MIRGTVPATRCTRPSACPTPCRSPRPTRSPGSVAPLRPGIGGPGRRPAGRRHHADRAAGHLQPVHGRRVGTRGGHGAPRNRLRVPIGIDADGRPVELDIKEAAQGGMGPHGLCHRRDRLRQVRAAPHAGPGPGDDAFLRHAQLRARRLQGRRDVPRHGRPAARRPRSSPTSRTSCRWSTACTTRCTARWSAARSCCARPATTPRCATTSKAARAGRRPARRCRRCSSCSTSSPSCCRPSRSSPSCSS